MVISDFKTEAFDFLETAVEREVPWFFTQQQAAERLAHIPMGKKEKDEGLRWECEGGGFPAAALGEVKLKGFSGVLLPDGELYDDGIVFELSLIHI